MSRFLLTADTRKAEVHLEQVAVRLAPEMARTTRFIAGFAAPMYRSAAPKDTGRLRRGIRAESRNGDGVVTVDARSDKGFDYVPVTRWGHRKDVIRPVNGQALRFTIGGRVLYRASVRGYKPTRDWVEVAAKKVEPVVDRYAGRFAREVTR